MRNGIKKIFAATLALTMSMGCLTLTGCDAVKPLEGDITGEVSSNGGFVVKKGGYFYFINGAEAYTADNTFGQVVKASLMRISQSDLDRGAFGEAETVVPSLIVSGDYTSGIYIYGDRVYYATPTSTKNISGEVENSYLDFKSTKLDGTDTTDYYFRASDNTTPFRFVEVDGVVYCLYVESTVNLKSYNVSTGVETTLVSGMTSYTLSNDKTDPTVYYTMNVMVGEESDAPTQQSYSQVYCVRADATEAPYEYTWSEEYLKEYAEEHDGALPYVNLGKLVLDGIGSNNEVTQYNHDAENTDPYAPSGYTYTLLSGANGGLYYTRSYIDKTESTGDGGWLFYIASEDMLSDDWNSVSGNADTSRADAGEYNDIVAYDTANASEAAIFLKDGDAHSYLYASNNAIFRALVTETEAGITTDTLRIVERAVSPTLMYTQTVGEYDYVYYSTSGSNGRYLYRGVYNGTEGDYNAILGSKDYAATQILKADYNSDWYLPEVIDGRLFYCDASAIGAYSYHYIATISLPDTNSELAAFNDRYEEINEEITDLQGEHSELSNLFSYYYETAGNTPVFNAYYVKNGAEGANVYESTDYYKAILEEAAQLGYDETALYSRYYQDTFEAFVSGTGDYADKFVDENGVRYNVRSYFINTIGAVTDADMEAIDNVYKAGYVKTIEEEEEDTGLPTWAIVLIATAGVLVAAAIVLTVVLLVRKKNKAPVETKELLAVDTRDDRSVDVYADEDEASEETKDTSDQRS